MGPLQVHVGINDNFINRSLLPTDLIIAFTVIRILIAQVWMVLVSSHVIASALEPTHRWWYKVKSTTANLTNTSRIWWLLHLA